MACNTDFISLTSCSGAGEIVTKKMFGDYAIYCEPCKALPEPKKAGRTRPSHS